MNCHPIIPADVNINPNLKPFHTCKVCPSLFLLLDSLPHLKERHLEFFFTRKTRAAKRAACAARSLQKLGIKMDGKVTQASHRHAVQGRILKEVILDLGERPPGEHYSMGLQLKHKGLPSTVESGHRSPPIVRVAPKDIARAVANDHHRGRVARGPAVERAEADAVSCGRVGELP